MNVTTDRCFFGFETAETEEKQGSCLFLSVTVPPSNEDIFNVEPGVDNLLLEVDRNNHEDEKATEQPLDSSAFTEGGDLTLKQMLTNIATTMAEFAVD
ncbi:hypothetical protein DPMN_017880 [Dreissena polymorpha]|uniref:Uncharacterized protein n=1 Tax=Dreissena polymorpha TaxID=45954 RepID=A0A9D4S7S8_DREPO|nr:hypothetical protein DPMN_017880 [Dreissena polymorpha]